MLCVLLGASGDLFHRTDPKICHAICGGPALMGNIMLLIPGIPFTNSIRDMLSGDTMSGLLRMCECLLRTVAVAAGFVGVMTLLGVAGI